MDFTFPHSTLGVAGHSTVDCQSPRSNGLISFKRWYCLSSITDWDRVSVSTTFNDLVILLDWNGSTSIDEGWQVAVDCRSWSNIGLESLLNRRIQNCHYNSILMIVNRQSWIENECLIFLFYWILLTVFLVMIREKYLCSWFTFRNSEPVYIKQL